jgi:predicted O-linked N-acetylglucosamine transferase (SPINDLY family)
VADVEHLLTEAEANASLGQLPQAEVFCREALAKDPGNTRALRLGGWLAAARGNHDAAVEALEKARAAEPEDPQVSALLARSLSALYRYEEAAQLLQDACARTPGRADLHRALGVAYWSLWNYAGAREQFRAASAAEPGDRRHIQNLLFSACYDPDLTPDEVADLHRQWGPRFLAGVRDPGGGSHANPPDPDRPLRVGYLSPDFRKHPVSVFLASLVAYHHPASVVTHCYASVAKPDSVTQALSRVCPNWLDVKGMDDATLARRIRADGIDILVDLAGYTGGSRVSVLGHRPAPIQASYLGYPATTGLPVMDWRLTDGVANPPGTERFYTERLARIEGGLCCYMSPPGAPDPNALPGLNRGRLTFGSLVNLRKVNRKSIALWARVLQAVPDSRLLLFRHSLQAPSQRERYLAEFERNGVDRTRVDIGWELPPPQEGSHFAVYHRVDAVLDTVPFSGHTSTCAALWMGVPVLTLAGDDCAGRLSATVLNMAGLDDFVTETPDAFVDAARRLAADLPALAHLRQTLRGRLSRSRLLNADAFTRSMEAAYRVMWRDWCAKPGAGR